MNELRDEVLAIFNSIMDRSFAYDGLEHTMAVVTFAALLSQQRSLDKDRCMAAAYLHDIATYQTHYAKDHALRSAKEAEKILRKYFDEEAVREIVQAISHHSDKKHVHGPMDELLKDADVLAHAALDGIEMVSDQKRLENMKKGVTR